MVADVMHRNRSDWRQRRRRTARGDSKADTLRLCLGLVVISFAFFMAAKAIGALSFEETATTVRRPTRKFASSCRENATSS